MKAELWALVAKLSSHMLYALDLHGSQYSHIWDEASAFSSSMSVSITKGKKERKNSIPYFLPLTAKEKYGLNLSTSVSLLKKKK